MRDDRFILMGVLLLFLGDSGLASKEFLLSPDGRHIPVEKEAKALPAEFTMKVSGVNPRVRLTEDDTLRWDDGGEYYFYTFGFDEGDTLGHYLEPLAGAIVKKVYIYNTDFCGTFCLSLNDALYDGEAMTSS